MKPEIHPEYVEASVTCACGTTFQTRSTKPVIRLEICSGCHPFFSGRQKFVDTAGRVERFQKRFAKTAGETAKKAAPEQPKMAKGQKPALSKKTIKVLSSAPIVIPTKTPRGGKAAAKPAAKPGAEKASTPKAH
jgi:large subunit ribosomal protein L31